MPRKVEVVIEVEASADQVWRAISEPQEIAGWFAPEVSVEPGAGGSITCGWDADMKYTTPITIWEPGKHLQTASDRVKDGETFHIAIDYFIETEKGVTRLRLVHSGVGDSADWDNEIGGYEDGWAMFMAMLAHRLRHPDWPVRQATVFRMIPVPRAEAWARLTGPDGLIQLHGDGHFGVNGTEGNVEFLKPNFFRGIIPQWDDALLNLFCEAGGNVSMITVALMLFGASVDQAPTRRAEWGVILDRLFPDPARESSS
ncbi:MAG: SRPBCC domain-containing protein [Bryobacteraceae bacterium]